MDSYSLVKVIHIISATILFGTGMGIAWFMFWPNWQKADAHERLIAARQTVRADWVFTLPAVIVQPVSGFWMVWQGGFGWTDKWLLLTYGFYLLAGACWIPVVWIQIRLKTMLERHAAGEALDEAAFARLFRLWFALGWPAFGGLVIVFWLMVAKPV